MSRRIGLDTINLRPTVRPGHTEYSMEYHEGLVRRLAGQGGDSRPAADLTGWNAGVLRAFYDAWDFDFLWHTSDGLIDWAKAGRVTDMGHAVYAADGSDRRLPANCPFQAPEQVWQFDPVREYGLPDFAEQVRAYQDYYDRLREDYPNQAVGGGYYRTVVSGAIAAFGWDMLLTAAADAERFAGVLERIGQYTLFHVRAWAQTDIEFFIQHDDMVWTAGPFMRPEFYRRAVFPIYRQLWRELHARGKKLLYCSDGRYDMFMDDIVACGADGLIFEPSNPYAEVVERFGGRVCLIGSAVDCRSLAFEPWSRIQAQIDQTLAVSRGVAGIMLAVGNHIPANVPDETCERYMDYLRRNWGRGPD